MPPRRGAEGETELAPVKGQLEGCQEKGAEAEQGRAGLGQAAGTDGDAGVKMDAKGRTPDVVLTLPRHVGLRPYVRPEDGHLPPVSGEFIHRRQVSQPQAGPLVEMLF